MPKTKFEKIISTDGTELPESFDKYTCAVMKVIMETINEATDMGLAHGMRTDQLISAVMSATVTELVRITECPSCTAALLGDAAQALYSEDGGTCGKKKVH